MINRGLGVKANIFEDPIDEDEDYIEDDVDPWVDDDEDDDYDDGDTDEFSWEWEDDEE